MLKSRVLLLQLMQNCFPMLPNPLESRKPEESREPKEAAAAVGSPSTSSSGEPLNDSVRAVWELYTHLCHSKNLSAKKAVPGTPTIWERLIFVMFVFQLWMVQKVRHWWKKLCIRKQ